MIARIFILVAIMNLVLACAKEENCFSAAGTWTTVDFTLDSFHKITVKDDVQFRLEQGNTFGARVAFYQNLQDGVLLEIRDSVLHIDNLNRCRWLKKKDRPQVVVTMPIEQLRHLEHMGTEDIVLNDTLKNPNFFFETDGNAPIVSFTYVGSNLRIVQHAGASNISVNGNAQNLSIYNGGHGETDFSGFRASFIDVSNLTGARVQVSATDLLQVRNYGRGTVTYCPEPQDKSLSNFSNGRIEVCQTN